MLLPQGNTAFIFVANMIFRCRCRSSSTSFLLVQKKAVESLLSRGVKYWQKPCYASESLSWLLEECKPGGKIDEFGEYAH